MSSLSAALHSWVGEPATPWTTILVSGFLVLFPIPLIAFRSSTLEGKPCLSETVPHPPLSDKGARGAPQRGAETIIIAGDKGQPFHTAVLLPSEVQ